MQRTIKFAEFMEPNAVARGDSHACEPEDTGEQVAGRQISPRAAPASLMWAAITGQFPAIAFPGYPGVSLFFRQFVRHFPVH